MAATLAWSGRSGRDHPIRAEESAPRDAASIELHPEGLEVVGTGWRASLRPTPFRLLAYLVAHRDRYVPAHELIEAVWRGRDVGDAALSTALRDVRRALRDDPRKPSWVATLRGVGYRFVGAVRAGTRRNDSSSPIDALLRHALDLARTSHRDPELLDLLARALARLGTEHTRRRTPRP